MSMLCPKCHGLMRSYERNGVTIDQCTECRGIFLDRGELEHLIDAEARFNAGSATPASAQPPPPRPAYPPAPGYPATGQPGSAGAPGRSPMADLSTIASMATDYLGKGKNKGKPKKGKKSFIDGLFG